MREISDEYSGMYEETECCFSVKTDKGLKARVFYKTWGNGNYALYPQGDKRYALIAFYIYAYNTMNKRQRPPDIVRVGSPSKDLTYLGE